MTEEYYLLSDSKLKLNCEDPLCQNCRYDLSDFDRKNTNCWILDSTSSLQVGRPLVYSWQTSEEKSMSYVANVFFSETYCAFYSRYIEPQVLSTHINLGVGNGTCLHSIDFRAGNETWIQKAFWVSKQGIHFLTELCSKNKKGQFKTVYENETWHFPTFCPFIFCTSFIENFFFCIFNFLHVVKSFWTDVRKISRGTCTQESLMFKTFYFWFQSSHRETFVQRYFPHVTVVHVHAFSDNNQSILMK